MQIYNISSDSEQTLSDKVVDYDLLQADVNSKANCQQQEAFPRIETQFENENIQDDAPPLDITPISVCFPRYTTYDGFFKISEKLQNMLHTVRIATPSESGNVHGDVSSNPMPCMDSTAGRIYRLQSVIRHMVNNYTTLVKQKCEAVKKNNNLQGNVAPEALSDHPGSSEVKAPGPEAPNAVPCDQPLPDNKVVVKKKRTPCIRHERLKVEFVIPSHVDTSDMDLDNLVPSFEARPKQGPRSTRDFSFAQRLRQWEFEVRERDFGKYDMYYYYGTLGYFRSIPEVTRFIMYEEYPGGKPLPGRRNKRKSLDACQPEVLTLEPGSSSKPTEAKRMRRMSKPKGDDDTPEAEVDGKSKTGKKRGRKPKSQSEVLSTVEQGSSSKSAAKRGRKRKCDQPNGNNATMSNLTMMLNNETVRDQPLSNPEEHVAVMLDKTMTGLQRVTGFTAELGNTSQGDEATEPSDGHPKGRESGLEDID